MKSITTINMTRFVWQNIVCCFGLPEVLITDNGTKLNCEQFKLFCAKLNIRNHCSSPAHPQANDQVEVTNRTIIQGKKKKLEGKKEKCVDELHGVLLSYITTARTRQGKPYTFWFTERKQYYQSGEKRKHIW